MGNPNQPRNPAGSPSGGQWASSGAFVAAKMHETRAAQLNVAAAISFKAKGRYDADSDAQLKAASLHQRAAEEAVHSAISGSKVAYVQAHGAAKFSDPAGPTIYSPRQTGGAAGFSDQAHGAAKFNSASRLSTNQRGGTAFAKRLDAAFEYSKGKK